MAARAQTPAGWQYYIPTAINHLRNANETLAFPTKHKTPCQKQAASYANAF